MKRKEFIKKIAVVPLFQSKLNRVINLFPFENRKPTKRVRPGDPEWPSESVWGRLRRDLDGQLTKLESPLTACKTNSKSNLCKDLFQKLKNPFYISNQPALSQTSGWLNAWSSVPSTYAIEAESTNDIVKGIRFALNHNLRLVVKGGGHSYQGRSSSEDALLLWTRKMNKIELHDDFVPQGSNGKIISRQAVSVGCGAVWMEVYNVVTTKTGRYVQGGGCTSVGVAGLIQSGGFGSFSKNYGLAAAGLLEAEVVTAKGNVLVVNEFMHPDLFWAIKGGGGSSFGIVTRVTLKTHDLPQFFGGVFARIKATSDEAFRDLIEKIMLFYTNNLHNEKWGEEISFWPNNSIGIQMVFQNLGKEEAKEIWHPFQEWVSRNPELIWQQPLMIEALPARHFWDIEFLKQNIPDLIVPDKRPEADPASFLWIGDQKQVGWFLHGFHSTWLQKELLEKDRLHILVDALFTATRSWSVSLHFNKGLSGAPEKILQDAKKTAMNPAVLNAFALALVAGSDDHPEVWPGIEGHEPNLEEGIKRKVQIDNAMEPLYKIVPQPASYISESNYFEKNWQQSFWGSNYSQLVEIKKKYDPEGLFFIHHGIGSEEWTDNGFTRRK